MARGKKAAPQLMGGESVIDVDRLRLWLRYDPETGNFWWLRNHCGPLRNPRRAGTITDRGYLKIKVEGIAIGANRLAWFFIVGQWPSDEVDHQDRDKLNNRFCNFREANRSQQVANTDLRSDNTSGERGVSWHKAAKKWSACICVDGRQRHLGLFIEKESAAAAYRTAAAAAFGDFAAHLSRPATATLERSIN